MTTTQLGQGVPPMHRSATPTGARLAWSVLLVGVCAVATAGGLVRSTQPAGAGTPASVPGAPTGVTAGPEPAGAFVDWSPPSSDHGSPITQYRIHATDLTDPERGGQTAATKGSVGQIVQGLTPGDHYVFTVRAVNAVGPGPASAPSNKVVPAPPAPPRGVSCEHIAGTTSGGVTLSSCHASGGGVVGVGTMPGTMLKGTSKGSISWTLGSQSSSTTIAVTTALGPNPTKGWCASRGLGRPYDVTGKVTADTEPHIAVGQAVKAYICISSAGAVKQNHYGYLSL